MPKAKITPPVLLSGGNPQIPKGDGDGPVQAFIAATPGWKQAVVKHLDALITQAIPDVLKAIKWNSPFYGVEGQGWFVSYHLYARFVRVAFFRGGSLHPLPPGPSKVGDSRYFDIYEADRMDEAQVISWMKQAAVLPGFLAKAS